MKPDLATILESYQILTKGDCQLHFSQLFLSLVPGSFLAVSVRLHSPEPRAF